MASKFPETGLSAVLELRDWSGQVRKYTGDLDTIDRKEKATATSSERAGRAFVRMGQDAQRGAGGVSALTNRLLGIQSAISIVNTAFNSVQRLVQGFMNMAEHGRQVESVMTAFNRITYGTGIALEDLREGVQGAVSDMRLMQITNTALINLEPQIRDVLAPAFGTVLASAMAGAAATGQDLDYILNKVILGIRRQSNRLLDDIGIWVDADVANQRYAESMGMVVSQMTDTDRQAAFAMEAIRQMGATIEQAGGLSVSSIQQMQASWENFGDRISVVANQTTEAALSQFTGFFDDLMAQFDPYPFFEAGANIVASLAEGILSGATFIIQAVTMIAQIISDFLMGFSPPKRGPLHTIDLGGMKMVEAWLSMFNRVDIAPAEYLAARVGKVLRSAAGLETGDQLTVLELLQARIQRRLESAAAALSTGGGDAALVRSLDQQNMDLQRQIRELRERQALEGIGGGGAGGTTAQDPIAAIQEELDLNQKMQAEYKRLGIDTTGLIQEEIGLRQRLARELIKQGKNADDELKQMAALQKQLESLRTVEQRQTEDRLAGLEAQLAANQRLQEQYRAQGMDTEQLLREELRLREQIAAEMSARGMDITPQLAQIQSLRDQLAGTGGAAGGSLPDLIDEVTSSLNTMGDSLTLGKAEQLGGQTFEERIAGIFEPARQQLEDLQGAFEELGGILGGEGPLGQMAGWFGDLVDTLRTGWQNALDTITGFFEPVRNAVSNLLGAIFGGGGDNTAVSGPVEQGDTGFLSRNPLQRLLDWVGEQLPVLGARLAEWGQAFIDWIGPAVSDMLAALPGIIGGIINWIGEQIPILASNLLNWASEFVNWVREADIIGELGNFLGSVIDWVINTFIPAVAGAIPGVVTGFLQWVVDAGNQIGPALGTFLTSVIRWITESLIPGLFNLTGDLVNSFLTWIQNAIRDAPAALGNFLTNVVTWFSESLIPSVVGWATSVGEGLINAIITGIQNIWESFTTFISDTVESIVEFFQPLIDTINNILQGLGLIQSESQSTYEQGQRNLEAGRPHPFGQHGINLRAQQAAIVGERGPELFIPTVAGRVISNMQSQRLLAGQPVPGLASHTTNNNNQQSTNITQVFNGQTDARSVRLAAVEAHAMGLY